MRVLCRRGVSRLAWSACLGTVALSFALLPTAPSALLAADGQAPELPEPLPLRRLLISPERLPFELQRARQRTLIQMSRAEFEALVAEAARANEALKNPPRLLEAHYHARLVDTALVGTAEWLIANPGAAGGILPLRPFNLALRQVQLDQRKALLGDLDSKALALWVEGAGRHTLAMTWSARGDLGPGGLRFELKVPSCVLSAIDLELPADRSPTLIGDNGLLSGPQPAGCASWRRWRLVCSGSPPFALLIRRTSAASEPLPLVLARLKTRQKLAADLVEADYDFNLEVLHGSIQELLCEGDPVLHPTAVSVGSAEIESWEVRPGPTPEAPFSLWIGLRDQFQGSFLPLRIHCLAPRDSKGRWSSPALRLKGAVFQGETLALHLAPEVRLEDWQAGDFELRRATSEVNGGQTLTLESGLAEAPRAEPEAGRGQRPALHARRPSARLRIQEPEYRTRQMAWWQIGPDSASLTVQIDYEVIRGRLFRLPVLLPADWTPDRVDLSPTDLLRNWTPMPSEHGQTLLVVELQRPLETPTTARLALQLRPVNSWPSPSRGHGVRRSEWSVAFPEVIPQGARLWEGALAIRIDPLYETTIHASVPGASADRRIEAQGPRSDERGDRPSSLQPLASLLNTFPSPWGAQPPDYLYRFRGQGVSGTLTLRPRSPRVRARCTSEVVLASGRAAVLIRLLLQPEVGNPDTIDLLVSAPVAGRWNWRSEGGRNAVTGMHRLQAAEILTPLLAFGAGTPWSAAGLFYPLFGRASWWRLTLAQPLREPLLLETTFDLVSAEAALDTASRLSLLGASTVLEVLAAAAGWAAGSNSQEGERWEVPLMSVLSAQPMDGEVQLYLAGTGRVDDIESHGLTEVATSPRAGVSLPWHTFRYSRLPVSLVLLGRIAAPERAAAAWVEHAHLTTFVEPSGRLLNYYSFQIRNWKQGMLPLKLPAGARLLALKLNGRWLAPLRLEETLAAAPVAQLPVATDSSILRFEVAYALPYPAGTLWSQVEAPLPGLPVGAVASGRTWCLPPGWMPLYEGQYQRHPGPDRDGTESGLGKVLGAAWLADPAESFASEDWRHRQERLLAEADTYLQARAREHTQRSLGEALHDLIYHCFKDQEALVIDAVALQEAGLWPATPLGDHGQSGKERRASPANESPRHALEELGLVCIPCRPAPLLTTQRQWAAWQGTRDRTGSVSDSVETAVAAAIVHGHDPSGRFRNATDWLRERAREHGSDTVAAQDDRTVAGPFASLPHPESWTEWEPIAGAASKETLVVLRQEALWGVSCFLSGVLLLAWWWVRRYGPRWSYGVALVWLAASVLGLLWLPAALRVVFWWPMLAGMALAAGRYLVAALRFRKAVPPAEPSPLAAAVLALLLTAGVLGQAAAPVPGTVWLLPGPPHDPESLSALVPPELLSQLKTLAHRGAAGTQGPLLLSARYEGTVGNGSADFYAEFNVHCFTEGRAMLTLPLAGVELQDALLDGSVAYPAALAAPQNGYGITLEGRGPHVVRVHFLVRLAGAGEDQELRFTIPELAQNQLTLLAPQTARYLRAVLGRGAQRVRADSQGVRLEADLGRVAAIAVRWRQEPEPPPPPSVTVKEAYYWELQRSGSRLLGLLDYSLGRGALTELTLALPHNWEVRQVELVAAGAGGSWPRLQDWTVAGTGTERRLRLEFQAPVTNRVQVLLELVPALPLTHRVVLFLPATEGVSFSEGWLAFRAQDLQASVVESRGVAAIEPALFERHWQPAGSEYPGLPERAYRLVRASASVPFLRLDLTAPPPRRESLQDLTWSVGPQQASLRARAKLKAPQNDLALVEWDIPPEVSVADVHGPEIRSWSRTGSRLQVWLQRSLAETTLELTGWVMRPAEQPLVPFSLPCLTFPGTDPHLTFVRVLAEKGWAVHAEELYNLGALPEPRPDDHDLSYLSRESRYRGIFRLRPGAAAAELQTVSWVEIRDRRVAFRATLDYHIGPHSPRQLTVRLRNWKGEQAHLEVPRRIQQREGRRDPLTRTWSLELPADLPAPRPEAAAKRLTCQLTGTLTLDSHGEVALPEVSLDEAVSSEGWLAIIGPGLRVEEQRGLVAVADAASTLGRWPALADAWRQLGGSIWRMDLPDWRLRLRTDFPLVEPSPARLLFEEQAAAVLDGRRWLHQATYWLYQDSGTHLGIRLPHGAILMMASFDGSEITPLQAGSDRLWLPLTGGSGLRILCLRWLFHADHEQLDRPRLEKPALQNILPLPAEERRPTFWTVHIPPGYQLAHAGAVPSQGNRVELSLDRAAAQFRATELLAQQAAGKADELQAGLILTAQRGFYSHCREAEYELALPERLREETVNVEDLAARLQKLQAANRQLARTYHLERIRVQAESQAAAYLRLASAGGNEADGSARPDCDDLLGRQGIPTYWELDEDSGAPPVHLRAIQADQRGQALRLSGLLLIILLLAWMLPLYPRAVAWLWASWPEQFVLLAGLVWLVRGASLAALVLLALGVGARLLYLGHWLVVRLRRSPSPAGRGATSTS